MSDKNKFEFFGYVIANDKDTAEKAFTKYELNDAGGDESNGGDDIDKKQVTNDYYQNEQADNFNNDLDNVDADWIVNLFTPARLCNLSMLVIGPIDEPREVPLRVSKKI